MKNPVERCLACEADAVGTVVARLPVPRWRGRPSTCSDAAQFGKRT